MEYGRIDISNEGEHMLYIFEIQKRFNCTYEYAEKIVNNMAALGLNFSECSQEQFDAIADETFQLVESGFTLV